MIINWRSVNIGMYVQCAQYMSRFDIGDLVSPEVKLCVLNEPLKWNSHSMVIRKARRDGSSFYPWVGWNPFVKVLMSLMG